MRGYLRATSVAISLFGISLSILAVDLNAQTAGNPLGEALPESKCGPLDKLGRCTGSSSSGSTSATSPSMINTMQVCRSSCNNLYGQCLAVSIDDKLKEDCNRKQVFCMKACDIK
jgi:hypothetical protein